MAPGIDWGKVAAYVEVEMRGWMWCGALVAGGCTSGVEGDWLGSLDCAGFPFDLQFTMEKDKGLFYVGSGEQEREYTSVDGKVTTVVIGFDLTLGLAKAGGAQQLDVAMSCTSEITVEVPAGGGDPETVAEGCTPLRYRDYAMTWDGEDGLDIAGPDACVGDAIRR